MWHIFRIGNYFHGNIFQAISTIFSTRLKKILLFKPTNEEVNLKY